MDIESVKQTLRGPMIPAITHFRDDLSVNEEAIKEEVNFLIEHGIQAGQRCSFSGRGRR